ncbi:hypothetical protein [Vreelandella salicampi]|uniref:Methyltransferase domain-containing protein n=1 Tax=Vreelandella salicampi TaxID=1449798 RepID=A0A7Z0LKP5_9GAMM|nr:hypothetical protein [Halomonas salicampi]NYS60693.1 hypothetical protein [Halomonas salicampi]
MNTIELQFDEKNSDVLIWNGQVVMSRTEEEYFEALFARLRYLSPSKVLEIGFGLGISAALIQKHLMPAQHDIFEVEQGIYMDLQEFANRHASVRPFFSAWQTVQNEEKYDFIFYDPFDYIPHGQFPSYSKSETATRLKQLLTPSGLLCHPHFGDGDVPDVEGFDTVIVERLQVKPIRMADESTCEDVAIVYHQPKA